MTSTQTEKTVGGALIAGFDGHRLPETLAAECAAGLLAGVILFKRNVQDAKQTSELIEEVGRAFPQWRRPVVMVDQEGGRVVRIREPLTALPPAARFGELDDPETTRLAGRLVGRELSALGFTVNLAPILDVNTNPGSPVIGDRSYGDTPEAVVRHGFAFARGLRDGGVWPCAKHFPGHGDANADSHLSLPVVSHPRARLDQVEIEPFRAWSTADLGPVMTAHVVYPSLDPEGPATRSKEILNGVLRKELRFKGAILSDDLEMGAVGEAGGAPRVAVDSIRAGVDALLVCSDENLRGEVRETLVAAAGSDPAFEQKLVVAGGRVASLANVWGKAPFEWLGGEEHRAEQARVLERLGIER